MVGPRLRRQPLTTRIVRRATTMGRRHPCVKNTGVSAKECLFPLSVIPTTRPSVPCAREAGARIVVERARHHGQYVMEAVHKRS